MNSLAKVKGLLVDTEVNAEVLLTRVREVMANENITMEDARRSLNAAQRCTAAMQEIVNELGKL